VEAHTAGSLDLGGTFVEDESLEVGLVAGVIDVDADEAAVLVAIRRPRLQSVLRRERLCDGRGSGRLRRSMC
jgi:hypothetical protein